jgi:signal transduction histidine kinase
MASDPEYPPSGVFLLQFPAAPPAGCKLRGRVHHAASGRSVTVTRAQDLIAFVTEVMGSEAELETIGPDPITQGMQAEAIRTVLARQVAVRVEVSAALARQGTLQDILQGCTEAVVRHLDAAFARIWVIRDGRMLELQASSGMYTHIDGAHSRIPVGQLKIGLIAQERRAHITNDLTHDPRISDPKWAQASGMVGFAGYPLLVNSQAIGVVAMFARHPVNQDTTDTLAAIADAIAQGIQRKQAEEEVLAAQARLAAVTRLTTMGELAASIAHEINQPLATVVSNAQTCAQLLQSDSPAWQDVHDAVSDIAEAGKRASDVIAKIRLLLRKRTPELGLLDVNDVILEVLNWSRTEIVKRQIIATTALVSGLPPVCGDRVLLQQVLINLIRNATDAMAEVRERPRALTVTSRCNDGREVDVAIEDVGTGFDPSHRTRIFEPFFSTKPDGMGMGLAICRSIIEAHGGRLTATINQPFGTTMRFVLPVASGEDA